jgi:hypothetical protein
MENHHKFLRKIMKIFNKFKTVIVFFLVFVLVACGGGTSDVTSSPVDKYIGTWVGCADHERLTVRISRASPSTLNYSLFGEAFNDRNCAGSNVGTMNYSEPFATLTFQSTETIMVEDPLSYTVSLLGSKLVDRFRVSSSGGTVTYSGPNVVGSCINYQGGNFCTGGSNPATFPSGSADYALYLANGTLTRISYAGGKFVPEEITLIKN